MFPPDHPYHWPTIGSAEDLRAASIDDVRDFFKTYYHPGNASLSLAGDIEIEQAFELAEQYFGDLPPGPAVQRVRAQAAIGGERDAAARRSRRAAAALSGLAFAGDVRARRCRARYRRGRARARQDVAALQDAGLRAPRCHRRVRVSAVARDGRHVPDGLHRSGGHPADRTRDRDSSRDRATGRRRRDRCRARTRPRANRSAVRLPPADDWRLWRQVGSAERLQHVRRRSGLLRSRSAAILQRHRQGSGGGSVDSGSSRRRRSR